MPDRLQDIANAAVRHIQSVAARTKNNPNASSEVCQNCATQGRVAMPSCSLFQLQLCSVIGHERLLIEYLIHIYKRTYTLSHLQPTVWVTQAQKFNLNSILSNIFYFRVHDTMEQVGPACTFISNMQVGLASSHLVTRNAQLGGTSAQPISGT